MRFVTKAALTAAVILLGLALGPEIGRAADGGPAPSKRELSEREVAFALQYGRLLVSLPDSAARRAPRDRWLGRDKAKHLAFSALWTLSAQYVLVAKTDWSEGDALPVSVASASAVGLAKEVYDWRVKPTHHFSTKDLVADAAGITLAVAVILL